MTNFVAMKRIFAILLLAVHLGMLILPTLLIMMLCKNSEEVKTEVKIPYFHSSNKPLVGDSSYLFAILERATSKDNCNDKNTLPTNTTDLSPSVYCLPSSLSLTIISIKIDHTNFDKNIPIQNIFRDVLTPPPKFS